MENENLVWNSNKAMVAYLMENGCKVHDVRLGFNNTILFGFDRTETYLLAKIWFDQKNEPNKSNI